MVHFNYNNDSIVLQQCNVGDFSQTVRYLGKVHMIIVLFRRSLLRKLTIDGNELRRLALR